MLLMTSPSSLTRSAPPESWSLLESRQSRSGKHDTLPTQGPKQSLQDVHHPRWLMTYSTARAVAVAVTITLSLLVKRFSPEKHDYAALPRINKSVLQANGLQQKEAGEEE